MGSDEKIRVDQFYGKRRKKRMNSGFVRANCEFLNVAERNSQPMEDGKWMKCGVFKTYTNCEFSRLSLFLFLLLYYFFNGVLFLFLYVKLNFGPKNPKYNNTLN